MSNGRYGSSENNKTDVELAEIRGELRTQGENIAKLTNKIEVMADSVTSMSVQMKHLVTKESCAEGRAALGNDLKKRMDSERDVTGVGVPVKELVRHWVVSKGKPSPIPTPYKEKKGTSYPVEPSPQKDVGSESKSTQKWNILTWIGLISGIIAIVTATYATSVFINKTIERQEQTDRILIEIQQSLAENNDDPLKQAPVEKN